MFSGNMFKTYNHELKKLVNRDFYITREFTHIKKVRYGHLLRLGSVSESLIMEFYAKLLHELTVRVT
jgi:hypothetical protein